MIKDIIVNLTVDATHDVAADYAISVARAFEAHLAGIGFAYELVVPGSVFGSVAVELIETHRAESEKAARAAVCLFRRGHPPRRTVGRIAPPDGFSGRGGQHVRPDRASVRSFGGGAGGARQRSRAET